jgi:Tfp pilus assembly protein PilV
MSRIWKRLAAESGSIMIEVLVGTVLLALTTAAVLDGLDGAQKTGLENRNRSAAATLAQQDIERMRSMPPSVLANLAQTRIATVAGVSYTVVSQASWVRDASGLVSCTTDSTEAEYLRLSATVTAPASSDAPVTATSLLTPPPGSFDDDTGTAAVKLTDRDGQPWEGVTVDLDGPSSLSATTNEAGCAIFAFVEADEWIGEVDGGLVGWNGESPAQSPVTVAANKTSLTQIQVDDPASLRATFVAPSGVATQWGSISVANAKLPNGYKSFESGTVASSTDADSLFPFHDGYGVFAGTCEANNPAIWDSDYFETSGYGLVQLDPGDLIEAVQVVVPMLTVRVKQGGVAVNAQVSVTQRDPAYDCDATIVNTGANGIGSDGSIDIAVPFGHYRVCAAYGGRRQRTASSGTPLDPNLTVAPLVKAVDMTVPTSGGSGSCP